MEMRTKAVMLLTEPLFFFDTDCLSAFLWVKKQSLLTQLYPGRIVVPIQVYREISQPSIPHLKTRVDSMLAKGEAKVESIMVGSEEYALYRQLTANPASGHVVIGRGEAEAIALAKKVNETQKIGGILHFQII
jgi:predicted nucleic acid-binding protein